MYIGTLVRWFAYKKLALLYHPTGQAPRAMCYPNQKPAITRVIAGREMKADLTI
jgi:hypothetical protein